MNLRETRLSSRSVIPVALALPIRVEPRHEKQREERKREAEASQPGSSVVEFYL